MKVIEIIISPSGQLTINAAGFQGADCEAATAFLEQTLGEAGQKHRKPEWFQRVKNQTQQQVGK